MRVPEDATGKIRIEFTCPTVEWFKPARIEFPIQATSERGEIRDRHGNVLAIGDADSKRSYPFGAAAAHLLGFTGSAPPDRDGNVFPLEGHSGVEKQLDDELAKGKNIHLTLDMRMQLATENAMRSIGAGCAIVTDPDTGEILALASVPSFDPNDFSPLAREKFEALSKNPAMPLFHRARGQYPPGSVFKVVTALTIPSGEDPVHTCTGTVKIDGREFRCWKPGGHGELNLEGALKHSCNCYFYQQAQESGQEEIRRVATLLGFGSRVGALIDAEPAGFLPSPESVKKMYDRDWGVGDIIMLSIGQGYLTATPQQVAGAIGAIATDGIYIQPHLLSGMKPRKLDLTENKISPDTLARVKSALFEAVDGEDGIRLAGEKIYGKTGTAMWKPGKSIAWFGGWTEARTVGGDDEARRLAVTVVVENGTSGRKVAAPLARTILAKCLALPPREPGEKLQPTRLAPAEGHTEEISIIEEK